MQATQGDWLPARAALHPTGLYFAMRDIPAAELLDPFMQETIVRVPARETVVQVERGDVGKGTAGSAPAGIILHVSRCGSTLVSQLLKEHAGAVTYAEPLPVNEILLPPHQWPREELVGALRSLGAAFARHARKPYVLKLTSWNLLFCDVVAEAFPDSPWVLCLRDPVEVGVSLLQRPPGWLWDGDAPAPAFARHVDPEGVAPSREAYVARLYAAYCEAAVRLDPRRGRLVDYPSLPATVWETIAPHFGQSVDEALRARMQAAAALDAKAPLGRRAAFGGDAAAKQAAASAALRREIDRHARPALQRLLARHAAAH